MLKKKVVVALVDDAKMAELHERFLGDIAHELCSPLARLRMAVGVLEGRIPDADRDDVAETVYSRR